MVRLFRRVPILLCCLVHHLLRRFHVPALHGLHVRGVLCRRRLQRQLHIIPALELPHGRFPGLLRHLLFLRFRLALHQVHVALGVRADDAVHVLGQHPERPVHLRVHLHALKARTLERPGHGLSVGVEVQGRAQKVPDVLFVCLHAHPSEQVLRQLPGGPVRLLTVGRPFHPVLVALRHHAVFPQGFDRLLAFGHRLAFLQGLVDHVAHGLHGALGVPQHPRAGVAVRVLGCDRPDVLHHLGHEVPDLLHQAAVLRGQDLDGPLVADDVVQAVGDDLLAQHAV